MTSAAPLTMSSVLPANDAPLSQQLVLEWEQARAGDPNAQAQWQVGTGGDWVWQDDGVSLIGTRGEWSDLYWQRAGATALRELKNFVIEVTLSGRAEAAGLSFGHYKDFLTALDADTPRRHLQLEVDTALGCWAFRVDGHLQPRCWWDAGVRSSDDLVNGVLTFKARHAQQVHFHKVAIHTFQASCQLSVVMTCYRFLQRLRVTLRNWCHQDLPTGAYEILVVNPNSPDGTHEHLAAVARSYPHLRVREVVVGAEAVTDKGRMINRAVEASVGEWVWLTDADCLFSPHCAAIVLPRISGCKEFLFYGQRRYLSANQTDALLAGRIDGLGEFDALARTTNPRAPDNAPWGYTQIAHRSTWQRIRYREGFNHFAHSDMNFIQDCKRLRIVPQQIEGLFCLHLDHPFAWNGTEIFL